MEGDYLELSQFPYNPHPFPYNSHQSPLGTIGFLTFTLDLGKKIQKKIAKKFKKLKNLFPALFLAKTG